MTTRKRGPVPSAAIGLLCLLAALFALPIAAQAGEGTGDAQVDRLADDLLVHLERTSVSARIEANLPVTQFDDLSLAAAQREAKYSRVQLAKLRTVSLDRLSPAQWVLAQALRNYLLTGAHAADDYWLHFAATPYAGGYYLRGLQAAFVAHPVATAGDRGAYCDLIGAYAALLDQAAAKTRAQAALGIRVAKPALDGVRATIMRMKSDATRAFSVAEDRLSEVSATERDAFRTAVRVRVERQIVPAYDRFLAVFDADYVARAPEAVGIRQYPAGLASYRRRIRLADGSDMTPEQIHAHGLAVVADLEAKMAVIRERVDFRGDRAAFNEQLRRDPRQFAKTPEELEARYRAILARVEPLLPRYFAHLPSAAYEIRRASPAAEAGMSFGFYQTPSTTDPVGVYYYNGSGLDTRSLVTASHMIYREVVPGVHILLGLEHENRALHPVRKLLYFGAFTNGWAEYAVELAQEMGALEDPYDRYGHLASQVFVATRLVVDTGMNALGWTLAQGRQYMREHTLDSDEVISTETLRYATDYFGQALDYRLGYEAIVAARRRAEAALGERFELRAFHDAMTGVGGMPIETIPSYVDRYIRGRNKARSSAMWRP